MSERGACPDCEIITTELGIHYRLARAGETPHRPRLNAAVPVETRRRFLTRMSAVRILPPGARVRQVQLAGVAAEAVTCTGATGPTVLYLHGGGFCLCSPLTHRALCGWLAAASGAELVAIDYRLAPEHPHPAALGDARRVWDALITAGRAPRRMLIAGDSAGGWLALMLAQSLRDEGAALPAGLILFSPVADLTLRSPRALSLAPHDPLLTPAWGASMVSRYA
ncbi:MAG: alpha/beta hydrolase fold domain-containing protein [Gammaproteobacteria bacterium]|nr:alpha/beta hydrolase fold domain-containing protein [Gammaproteobacteria bacterium]